MSTVLVKCYNSVNAYIIHYINDVEDKIRGHIIASILSSTHISCPGHCDPSSKRWKWPSMHGWKMRQRLSVGGAVVCAKTMKLCSNTAQLEGKEKASVHTSKGWFQNFQKRMSLQNK